MAQKRKRETVSVVSSELAATTRGSASSEKTTIAARQELATQKSRTKVEKSVTTQRRSPRKKQTRVDDGAVVPLVEDDIAGRDVKGVQSNTDAADIENVQVIETEVIRTRTVQVDEVDGAPKKSKKKRKGEELEEAGKPLMKQARKRKTKEEKEREAMPLASRTSGLKMFVGAHVSGAGGPQNSVTNAVHIGANAFALFLKSQRKWESPPLQDQHKDLFHAHCKEHVYKQQKHIVPHGSYLVNLANEDPSKHEQAYASLLDDLRRCEALGIGLFNFHPGNTLSRPRPEALSRIARALNKAHKATHSVTILLENMAAGGNILGSTFEDLRDIIGEVEDQSRIGVCFDTCHAFAGGYDLRSPEAFKNTFDQFDSVVGMRFLKALHMNDSKAPFRSRRDLHQNIGVGFLGLRAFHNIMNDKRFENLPLVLETPIERKDADGKTTEDRTIWAKEIKLLESLTGMDAQSKEFLELERQLSEQGVAERQKIQDQVDRRDAKEKKQTLSGGRKKKVQAIQDADGNTSSQISDLSSSEND